MVETIKRKVKKTVVKEEVVELKIQLSAKFFDNMDTAKISVAEQRGYDITYGEYIEEAMNDLVQMVGELSAQLQEMSTKSQYQQMLPEVVDKSEPKEEESELSEYDQLMQKFVDADPEDPMVG
jgi:hypothetical protein